MGRKIAVIGGGSGYAAGIVNTLAQPGDEFAGAEVVLMDLPVGKAHQDTILRLGKHLAEVHGADISYRATLDLDDALTGADFVITCFRIGGREALNLDVSIPMKYDIYGDETAGPGGIFFALRSIPVMVDIAKRMERLCPKAYLINYANPTAFIADAVRRETDIEELSLCNGYLGVGLLAEQFLGYPAKEVVAFTAGVNHFTWTLRAMLGEKDITQELVEALKAEKTEDKPWRWQLVIEIVRRYGIQPSPGSHMVDYLFRREVLQHQKAEGHWGLAAQDKTGERSPEVWKHYEELIRSEKPEFDMTIPGMRHLVGTVSDMAVAVIASIIGDRREIMAVNLPNVGQVGNLGRGEIVESPAVIGAFGAAPIAVGDIPEKVLPITEILTHARKLTVDAALTGDRERLLDALMSDPLVDSVNKAKPMMEEMLKAQAKWLPQFAG